MSSSLPTFNRDKVSITLPSGRSVTVLESTGKEEKILGKFTDKKATGVIEDYLSSVTEDLDGTPGKASPSKFLDMLSGDRIAILIHNRILTHGEIVTYKLRCNSCGHSSEHELDLNPIISNITPYKLGDLREFSIKLSELEIFVSLPTGETENRVAKIQSPDFNSKLSSLNIYTLIKDGSKMPVRLDDLKSKHISVIRKALKEHECFIDTVVNLNCTNCGVNSQIDAVVNPDFLFPNSM